MALLTYAGFLQFSHSEPTSFFTSCSDEESSGQLAVIIIPSLLALSTVSVVALIFYSLYKNKHRVQSPAAHFVNGMPAITE